MLMHGLTNYEHCNYRHNKLNLFNVQPLSLKAEHHHVEQLCYGSEFRRQIATDGQTQTSKFEENTAPALTEMKKP